MIKLLVLLFIIWVLVGTQKEKYSEFFGFSGYKKSSEYISIDDSFKNTNDFQEVPVKVGPDHLQQIILNTNKYLTEKIDDCTYIIETSDIKQYKNKSSGEEIVRAMFMIVRNKGYAFGFAITVESDYKSAQVLGVKTQPLSIDTPSDISAYVTDGIGQEFFKYDLIKEKGRLTRDQLLQVS